MESVQAKQEKAKVQGMKGLKALQARFDELEAGARERLLKALGAGQHRLTELDGALEKWSREDWSVDALRKRLEALRKQADVFRAKAVERMNEIPGTAVKGLASSTRVPVQNLARELDRLAKLVEPKAAAVTTAREVEVIPPPEPKAARVAKQKAEV